MCVPCRRRGSRRFRMWAGRYFRPAALMSLSGICPQRVWAIPVGPPDVIIKGSSSVLIGGRPAARMGDQTAHGGQVVMGCPTVIIGG